MYVCMHISASWGLGLALPLEALNGQRCHSSEPFPLSSRESWTKWQATKGRTMPTPLCDPGYAML